MKSISKISTLLLLSVFLFVNCEKDNALDCNGVEGGTAYLDDCAECVGGTTGKEPCIKDCNGVEGGTAYLDDCAECVGGTTGKEPCIEDCNEELGGTAYLDDCAECVGGKTGKQPCLNDTRDNKRYKTVKIGTQVWMAENLNYTTVNSWCYENSAGWCGIYGRLYDWNAALTACPTGWRLPSDADWTVLTTYLGGEDVAGGKMKSTTGWKAPNTGATNTSGFTGLPGGYLQDLFDTFDDIDNYGNWWSSTEEGTDNAWYRSLEYQKSSVDRSNYDKKDGYSCRCLKD